MSVRYDHGNLYIDEVEGHRRRSRKVFEFTHSSTKAAAAMFVGAIIALALANSPFYHEFLEFWHAHVLFGIEGTVHEMTLAHIINDVFMAIFFLLVGLEIKYEMTAGELTDIRKAALPIVAALGGVLAPIGIYLAFTHGTDQLSGWGVPAATDIAFALGILALLGDRVPSGVRVFLSTLAVADDIMAIIVIALFYGGTPDLGWLCAAAIVVVALIVLNKRHVYSLSPYLVLGAILWYCVFMSGIHSTIAGVLLALTIPARTHVNPEVFASWGREQIARASEAFRSDLLVIAQRDYLHSVSQLSKVANDILPPAVRLEHSLYPWVYFAILPLFALTNADVSMIGVSFGEVVAQPAFLGVFCGLLLGKPIGITLFSFVLVKLKLASLPAGVRWPHLIGAALLGGVGFTMAIFVANLAFADPEYITVAKAGIMAASSLAGLAGLGFLFAVTSKSVPTEEAQLD